MGKLYEIVFDFFHDQAEHDSLPMIKLDYEGAAGRWTLYVRVREEAEQVIGLSELPARAPVDRRPAMAEFVTRANYGLNIGNFEMTTTTARFGSARASTSKAPSSIRQWSARSSAPTCPSWTTTTPASPRCSKVARHPRTRSPKSNPPNLEPHIRSCRAGHVALR